MFVNNLINYKLILKNVKLVLNKFIIILEILFNNCFLNVDKSKCKIK